MNNRKARFLQIAILGSAVVTIGVLSQRAFADKDSSDNKATTISDDAQKMIVQGRDTFRFDTFGDEAFWGDTLQLHKAIEGTKFGGVGAGVSPAMALSVGLKVDADALPQSLVEQVKNGKVDLNDPATTLALLKLNAVIGLTGFFNSDGSLKSVGIQCAFCHSTVDRSFSTSAIPAGSIGKRLDGWPNRDLNVGAIISLSPNLQAVATTLSTTTNTVTVDTVKQVLAAWGPGKFDAELFLDGKGFNPQQMTNGVTTGTNVSAATLIPPAYGLAGFDLHTWTGWGSVTYWNAFVANLEMHGIGRFFDPRLNNATKFPLAVKNNLFDVQSDPDDDRITKKLGPLHVYQLSIPAPTPDVNPLLLGSVKRGDELFSGKAKCNNCHVEPLWTEPGWNMHTAQEVCIDDFQAARAPDDRYRTAPLAGIALRTNPTTGAGPFYHDGRFKTLLDVVNHYDNAACKNLGLTDDEKKDLIQYLLSL
jgi:hypothetical protein